MKTEIDVILRLSRLYEMYADCEYDIMFDIQNYYNALHVREQEILWTLGDGWHKHDVLGDMWAEEYVDLKRRQQDSNKFISMLMNWKVK